MASGQAPSLPLAVGDDTIAQGNTGDLTAADLTLDQHMVTANSEAVFDLDLPTQGGDRSGSQSDDIDNIDWTALRQAREAFNQTKKTLALLLQQPDETHVALRQAKANCEKSLATLYHLVVPVLRHLSHTY